MVPNNYLPDSFRRHFDFCENLMDLTIHDPEAIFISIPTTSKHDPHAYEFGDLKKILNHLEEINYEGLIIIKSTICSALKLSN